MICFGREKKEKQEKQEEERSKMLYDLVDFLGKTREEYPDVSPLCNNLGTLATGGAVEGVDGGTNGDGSGTTGGGGGSSSSNAAAGVECNCIDTTGEFGVGPQCQYSSLNAAARGAGGYKYFAAIVVLAMHV